MKVPVREDLIDGGMPFLPWVLGVNVHAAKLLDSDAMLTSEAAILRTRAHAAYSTTTVAALPAGPKTAR